MIIECISKLASNESRLEQNRYHRESRLNFRHFQFSKFEFNAVGDYLRLFRGSMNILNSSFLFFQGKDPAFKYFKYVSRVLWFIHLYCFFQTELLLKAGISVNGLQTKSIYEVRLYSVVCTSCFCLHLVIYICCVQQSILYCYCTIEQYRRCRSLLRAIKQ